MTGRRDAWFAVEMLRTLTGPHPWHSGLLVLQVVGAGYLLLVARLALVRRVKLPGLLLAYTGAMVLPLLVASRWGCVRVFC